MGSGGIAVDPSTVDPLQFAVVSAVVALACLAALLVLESPWGSSEFVERWLLANLTREANVALTRFALTVSTACALGGLLGAALF